MHKSILETDIYRVIAIIVGGILGFNMLMLGMTADEIVSILSDRPVLYQRIKSRLIKSIFFPTNMMILGGISILAGILLNYKTIAEYLILGKIDVHWTYVLTGAFLVLVGAELIAGAFMQKLLMLYKVVIEFRKNRQRKIVETPSV